MDLEVLRRRLAQAPRDAAHAVTGRLLSARGLELRAVLPGARIGDVVSIARRDLAALRAEVVGFDEERVILMPLDDPRGVGLDDVIAPTGESLQVLCGEGLLGRVLDGLGAPCDGRGPIDGACVRRAIDATPPDPLTRPRIARPFATGVRVIDGLLTLGEGQRVGLFSGSGVGKSALLGQIARHAEVDVVVIALVGERGREVREFLEDHLDEGLRARSVAVVATSDAPPLVRLRAAFVATTVAEHFREAGRRVLLLVDSITRVARAQRDVGLAAGEHPVRRGHPPSVLAMLPRLLERAGTAPRGSVTALYTVLVEGDDLEEPIADEVRGTLDGHLVLDRGLAARGRFPPVDPLRSVSRVMDAVTTDAHRAHARRVRALLSAYESRRELIALGAYAKGADAVTDAAVARLDALERFLAQSRGAPTGFDDTVTALAALAAP